MVKQKVMGNLEVERDFDVGVGNAKIQRCEHGDLVLKKVEQQT